jgi:hypothetical protein
MKGLKYRLYAGQKLIGEIRSNAKRSTPQATRRRLRLSRGRERSLSEAIDFSGLGEK